MPTEREEVAGLIGQTVIVDTSTPYIYVGVLKDWQEHFVVLSEVDVHDISEGRSGKELYALEARRTGIQKNRRAVTVRKHLVVSLSLLDDIISY